ncbi:hypothetical protein CVS40_3624 [Lucilia cuprina]|nr:hypothetical protein CVS40_3624 [Lucilia cuprina]
MSSNVLTLHSVESCKNYKYFVVHSTIYCKHFNVPIEDENMIASIPNDEIDENSGEIQDNINGVEIRDNIARSLL